VNRDFKFFGVSGAIHGVIVALALTFSLPQEEEEIVLTLDLSTPQQSTPTPPQPVVQQPKQVVEQKPVVERTVTPLPVANPVKAQPVVQPTPVLQPVTTPPVVSKPSPPAPPPVDLEKEYLADHLKVIRQLLVENRKYPRNAKLLGQEGEVEISFRLNSDGSVDGLTISKSSGFELLDNGARDLIIATASRFPKPPKTVRIKVPLKYALQ
jgi:protein TonB